MQITFDFQNSRYFSQCPFRHFLLPHTGFCAALPASLSSVRIRVRVRRGQTL